MATPMTTSQLLALIKAEGLNVKEVAGWRDRCRCHTGSHEKGGKTVRAWGPINGTMVHITGGGLGSRTVEKYIADIINGDPALPCKVQFVVAPDGTVYLNSAGRSNHAGEISQKSLDGAVAGNFSTSKTYDDRRGSGVDGNSHFYGIENIAAVTMTAAQRATSVKICAAIARHYEWTGQESVGHGECSSARTKADPNLDMGTFRKDVMTRVKAGTGTKPPVEPPTAKTFRLMLWNTKAPELTITGVHKWVGRRLGVVARIKQVNPTVLGMIESGSSSNLTWYKAALKVLGLTWAQHGAKWQNTWFSKDAKLVTSGLHSLPNGVLLNGDNKELDWSILNIDGLEWIIGVGHPENENGTDKRSKKTGEQLRQLQVENYLNFLDKTAAARTKPIPQRRRVLVIDGNSPTGGVKRWVHGHTHYRDVFDLAAKTAGKNLRTNNKWAQSLAVIPGVQERIDLILIGGNYESTSLPPQVVYAGNHDQHKLSDHNDVSADIVNQ